MAGGDRREGGLQISEGLDAVDLAGLDQRGDAAPGDAAFVMAGEECILAIEGHCPFILPMSAKSGKFITVGIPISAGRSVSGG